MLLCQALHKFQLKASTLSLHLEPGQMIEEPLNNLALFYDPPSQQLNNKKKVTALFCQGKQILASQQRVVVLLMLFYYKHGQTWLS